MPRDRRATEDMVEVQEELGERGSAPTETWHWRIAADGFSPFVSGDLGGPGAGRVPPKGLRCQAGHLWGFFFLVRGPFGGEKTCGGHMVVKRPSPRHAFSSESLQPEERKLFLLRLQL